MWYRRIDLGPINFPHKTEKTDPLLTDVVCGASCGGPMAFVREIATDTALPRLQITDATGSVISAIDWTFTGLKGMEWTPLGKNGGYG